MTAAELVTLLSQAANLVNAGISKTLTARRSIEVPPLDSRHLTDTRTRVSTLLEYSLAYEMNQVLEKESKGFTVSSVLWNVFPDLLVRDPQREPIFGLEVKALHTAAEEKSANLSTPLHLIRKGADFVVIIIWVWKRTTFGSVSVTYPHIELVKLFDAYLLAQCRDYSWLFNQGGRRKGVDVSTPIITPKERPKGKRFKAEEGNMGKLMRIDLETNLPPGTPHLASLKKEAERYQRFKESVLLAGITETFREICFLQQATNCDCQRLTEYPKALTEVGRAVLPNGNPFAVFTGGGARKLNDVATDATNYPSGTVVLWLSAKLNWSILKRTGEEWREIDSGEKPDSAYEKIENAIAQ